MNKKELTKRAEEIKHGLCLAMSKVGMYPSELEHSLSYINNAEKLDKVGGIMGTIKDTVTAPFSLVSGAKEQILGLMGLGLAIGAAGGVGTAVARHKLENIADSSEDEEMRKKRMRIEAYNKMINDLKTDMASV